MILGWFDFTIIFVYLISISLIGVILKKRASENVNSYLLGGNKLPWYFLGLSNASGMFDISGTMWLVAIGFVYGLKSIWLPWVWPVFNQIFLMIYLSVWLRRSNVTTGAQWIGTRFGFGRGAQLSHTIVVIFALINCLGMLGYGFIGLGKFMELFLPWEVISHYVPFHVSPQYVPHLYGIIFTMFAVLYTVLGGMTSIVIADVLQYLIMTISSVIIAVIAMHALSTHALVVPDGWMNPFFGWKLNLDWSHIIPDVMDKIQGDQFGLFSIIFMLMLFKGVLLSIAGPAPTYDMQKILATKSPREGALMSGFVSVILNPIRYLMITAFVVLGLLFYDKLDLMVGGHVDFEQILPSAINEFVPTGLIGLLLAGLLAAFMSTFSGTLNAAQAYLVNDLYLKYIKPKATNKETASVNYITGVVVVIVSIIIGFFAKDVNSLLQWITSALYGSYVASNVLKWHWWRFNGYGYFWGMVAGMIPALIFPLIFAQTLELYYFPVLLITSLIGCFLGSYLTKPTEIETLKSFYTSVRPWGFWKPVYEQVIAENPSFVKNNNFKRDAFNVVIGIIWQTALVVISIYVVLLKPWHVSITVLIIIVTSIILKFNWYDKLEKDTVK